MAPLFSFLMPRQPPISTGSSPACRSLPPDSHGSLTQMAMGINDVLTAYRDRFGETAAAGLLDVEYSRVNFFTARILDRKIRVLRLAILFFLGGVLMAVPHHLMHQ